MAYTYEISFHIASRQMDELSIGHALERGLGYLKTLLPSEPGFHVRPRHVFADQR